VKVSAVVVSHGHAAELERLLPALAPQVDELVVVANVPGSVGSIPEGVRVLENARSRSFAANANAGIAATRHELVLVANPDTVPEPDAVAVLRDFMDVHPRCGVAGPGMLYRDGSWQPSRRRFPTVGGTIVRRTPLRLLFPPMQYQRRHYLLDELGGFDAGFRLYGEDIDLQYRAHLTGWERWYVPAAVVRHEHKAETDKRWLTRRTLWHWAGIARFVRKHPERLRALR